MNNKITFLCLCLASFVAAAKGDYASNVAAVRAALEAGCNTKFNDYSTMFSKDQAGACADLTATNTIKDAVTPSSCTVDEFNSVKYVMCIPYYAKAKFDDLPKGCQSAANAAIIDYSASNTLQDALCKVLKTTPAIKTDVVTNGCTVNEYQGFEDNICGATSVFLALTTVLFCMAAHLFARA